MLRATARLRARSPIRFGPEQLPRAVEVRVRDAFQFNGRDAPTRNGIDVPKEKRYFNHLNR
jgi:hypothetical protein